MQASNVLPKGVRLTEAQYRAVVAKTVLRLSAEHGCARLALDVGGVDERTLRNTRDEKTSLAGVTLFNLLGTDASALDEIVALFGMRVVPIDAEASGEGRLLADTMTLAAAHAEALADGHIDHSEAQKLSKLARPVVQVWGGRVAGQVA